MSIQKTTIVNSLSKHLDKPLVEQLLLEYVVLKQEFALGHFRPTELNGGRFGECIVRVLDYIVTNTYIPLGTSLGNKREPILNRAESTKTIPESMQIFVPKLTRVIMDVRNRRDVAHIGKDVNPNYSDSLLICQCADWILIEIIRSYCSCTIDEARNIVTSINQTKIPIVTQIGNDLRVLNTNLDAKQKTLVVLHHKNPNTVSDSELAKIIKYQNVTRYRSSILKDLDDEALIHYTNNTCTITLKGVKFVEKNIPLDLIIN